MPRITIHQPGRTPQPYRFDLETQCVRIGRAKDNMIVVGCASISGRHAEMLRVPGGYVLKDLGSTNGMDKDGESVDRCMLASGDYLKLGDVGFGFELDKEEIALLADELGEAQKPLEAQDGVDLRVEAEDEVDEELDDSGGFNIDWVAGWQVVRSPLIKLGFVVGLGVAFYLGMTIRNHQDPPQDELPANAPAEIPMEESDLEDDS